jgi:ankyrin repeat protein
MTIWCLVLLAVVLTKAVFSLAWYRDAAAADAGVLDQEAQPTIRLIVMITGKFGNTDTFGAGIIFGREKDRLYITTANHVVRKGTEAVQNLQIQLRGLPGTPLEATLLKSADPRRDLAVLSVERLSQDGIDVCAVPFGRLSESTAARRGAEVYPVGNPNGVPWSMPVVPDRIAQIVGDHFLFQSQFISKGHSGGGLLDERGTLIGMIQNDEPPFGWAIQIDKVMQVLQGWGYPVHLRATVKSGKSPLHTAAISGDVAALRTLLDDECTQIDVRDDEGWTPLHDAARHGHLEIIRLLLDASVDIMARSTKGTTPLHKAGQGGQPEVVKVLLEAGAEVNAANAAGQTPLHYAASEGQVAAVRVLLQGRANLKATDVKGYTALDFAAAQKREPVVEHLLQAGAHINVQTARNLLHLAAQEGWVTVVSFLTGAGFDANAPDKGGDTPLHKAVAQGHVNVVKLLLDAGADPNRKGRGDLTTIEMAPLYLAMAARQKGNRDREALLEIVKILVNNGADVNAPDFFHGTPLEHAVLERWDLEVFKVLVAAGANVQEANPGSIKGIFEEGLLRKATRTGNLKAVEFLLAAGTDIRAADQFGDLPIHIAIRWGHVEVAKRLIDAGTSVNASDARGKTLLHKAAASGQPKVAKTLLANGAKVNARTQREKQTPLHFTVMEAIQQGKQWDPMEVAKVLLEAGADVNARDTSQNTPLHYAALHGHTMVAKLLLEAGGDINAKNRKGKTPLALAQRGGIVALLRTHGATR